MTAGLLLDSHVLLWLDEGLAIRPEAQFQIGAAAASGVLFVSHISLWELGVALHKKSLERRPNLRGLTTQEWFRSTTATLGIKHVQISSRIALEAADAPSVYGSGDPGDCFLIATARVRKLTLVTRDGRILDVAKENPGYLSVMPC